MRAAHEKFEDQGFEVLSISVQESEAPVRDFIDEYGLEYELLLDRDGAISAMYGLYTTPTTFFVTPEGWVVDAVAGVVDQHWLDGNMSLYGDA